MQRLTNPLVIVIDDVDARPALACATKIALAHGTPLTLLGIGTSIPEEAVRLLPPAVRSELQSILTGKRIARLDALAEEASAAGISVHIVCREGLPFLVAIREVLTNSHDLVIKTTSPSGPSGRAFSSTDKHLLRKCPCPLWLTRKGGRESRQRILAAVDPDPNQPEQLALSEAVLHAAVAVARMDSAQLDVLHAWQLFGESILRGPETSISDPEVDYIVGNAMNRHAQYLDKLIDSVSDPSLVPQSHLIHGAAAGVITEFVKSHEVDLLVMGTVGRTGIAGLLMGNTAERVLSEIDCSILALKPDGFVSPVLVEP